MKFFLQVSAPFSVLVERDTGHQGMLSFAGTLAALLVISLDENDLVENSKQVFVRSYSFYVSIVFSPANYNNSSKIQMFKLC